MLQITLPASMASPLQSAVRAGFACHWLHERTKRPIGAEWQNAPVASFEQLCRSYGEHNNLGVRLGEPSAMAAGGYLHAFDIDIRIADLAEEAWRAFGDLFPDLDIGSLPTVISGSGGESRHLYFVTGRPLFGKKLAISEGKVRVFDKEKGREVWKNEWEIALLGTGQQVVLPPSVHPVTGQPYRWLREFNFDLLEMGLGPVIASASIERLAEAVAERYEFEAREPLTFESGQLERDLDDVPVERIDDYHDWIALGQALHHQFGGSTEGYDLWYKHSQRSEKFDGKDLLRKWRGFGRSRRQPVTMGTVRQWALDARRASHIAAIHGAFDEEDEDDIESAAANSPSAARAGAPRAWTGPVHPQPHDFDIGALLGEKAEPNAVDDIDAIGTAAAVATHSNLDWMSLLDVDPDKGAIRVTLHNVELIVCNDERLKGLPQLNEFTREPVQRAAPGRKGPRRRNSAKPTRQLEGPVWNVKDPINGDLWSDDRDFAIRSILEAPKTQGGYGMKISDRDLKASIVLSAMSNPFHPVREYLDSLVWDGEARVERLFTHYLGAADSEYHRATARLMLVAAVSRVFEPGHKFDFAVILEGRQGKRKSTFIRILGREWYNELDGDFHDSKQMIELMQGAWVLEIPELSGMNRADVRAIKAFMSRQTDRARLAYARRATEFPRQCIFIGSTNDREYLRDDTGGRRFWPVACEADEIDTDSLAANIDQIWAEAVAIYRSMRAKYPSGTLPLFLTGEAAHQAVAVQESRRVETESDALAGQISAWLETPIATGSLDADLEPGGEARRRDKTCLAEIWCECLGKDRGAYTRAPALMLGSAMRLVPGWDAAGQEWFGSYGKQRMYYRGGRAARVNGSTPIA